MSFFFCERLNTIEKTTRNIKLCQTITTTIRASYCPTDKQTKQANKNHENSPADEYQIMKTLLRCLNRMMHQVRMVLMSPLGFVLVEWQT